MCGASNSVTGHEDTLCSEHEVPSRSHYFELWGREKKGKGRRRGKREKRGSIATPPSQKASSASPLHRPGHLSASPESPWNEPRPKRTQSGCLSSRSLLNAARTPGENGHGFHARCPATQSGPVTKRLQKPGAQRWSRSPVAAQPRTVLAQSSASTAHRFGSCPGHAGSHEAAMEAARGPSVRSRAAASHRLRHWAARGMPRGPSFSNKRTRSF